MAAFDSLVFGIGAIAVFTAFSLLKRQKFRSFSPLFILHFLTSLTATLIPAPIIGFLICSIIWLGLQWQQLSPLGLMGLAMMLAGGSGILAYVLLQLRARTVFADALGGASVAAQDVSFSKHILLRMLLPFKARLPEVERLRDISYGGAGKRNLLDIYRPRNAAYQQQRLPILIYVHGSGWMVTNKNMHALPMLNHIAAAGWIVVAINYRLSPKYRFPAHLVDVKLAIAWVRKHIGEYGGDSGFVAISGGSAGGHLAAIAALNPKLHDLHPSLAGANLSLDAAIPIYARYDFLDRDGGNRMHAEFMCWAAKLIMRGTVQEKPDDWELASPITQINPDAPPFFVIHGAYDSLIPVETVYPFVEKMNEISRQPVVYAELPFMQHAYDIAQSPATEYSMNAVRSFLEDCYLKSQGRRQKIARSLQPNR